MKLPNREHAYVPKEKLTAYLLSETHAAGRSKAIFFRNLGFDETSVDIRTIWIIEMNQDNPRFVTAYPI